MTLSKSAREFHRKTGARSFNEAWVYLEKKRRTRTDDRRMLDLVHASRLHWGLVGTDRNRAIADWQISRVYAALGESQLALNYARSSLSLCRKSHLTASLGSAHEGLARALAIAKDFPAARKHLTRAQKLFAALLLDDEDRRTYLDRLEETERLIPRK